MPKTGSRKANNQSGHQLSATKGPRSSSEADRLRKEGNKYFMQARDNRFSPCVRRSRLDEARNLYNAALGHSQSENGKAACHKNLGAVNKSLFKIELEVLLSDKFSSSFVGEKEMTIMKFYSQNSIDHYVHALYFGARAHKSREWLENLQSSLVDDVVEWTVEQSRKLSSSIAISLKRSLAVAFANSVRQYPTSHCEAAIAAHKVLAESLFQQGIKELDRKDDADGEKDENMRYIKCLKYVSDCHQPLSVALSLSSIILTGDKYRLELADLEGQVQLYQNICQSVQARIEGDRLLRSALYEDEEMNVDCVWDAIDFYKEAVKLTREQDVENEAIATSRVGKVYSEVFKDNKKAHNYHFQATKLALSIVKICPRITTTDWYWYSNRKVDEYQKDIKIEEAKLRDRKRAPLVLKLEEKLQALAKAANGSIESFLRYVYQEHPHPDPTKQLGRLNTKKSVKATVRKALLHYHPDTNTTYGDEWVVLCEEIARYLNRKYENMK